MQCTEWQLSLTIVFSYLKEDDSIHRRSKDITRKLEIIMNLVKSQDTKLIYINLLHFYALTTNQKEIKERIPFTMTSKRIKYLGITLPKEAKVPNFRNYKTLIKETEMTQIDGKIHCVLGLEDSILLK